MVRTYDWEQRAEERLWKCFHHHPMLWTLFCMVGFPAITLLAVVCMTAMTAIPIVFLLELL